MTAHVTLALDVDGVIIPVVVDGELPEAWTPKAWERTSSANHNVPFARPVVDFLLKLHEMPSVSITWQTTWMDSARTRLAPDLGLPDWAVLSTRDEYLNGTGWWKTHAVARLLAEGHHVIWIDDDLEYSEEVGDLDSIKDHPRLFKVSPNVHRGLEAHHLDAIRKQIEKWSN